MYCYDYQFRHETSLSGVHAVDYYWVSLVSKRSEVVSATISGEHTKHERKFSPAEAQGLRRDSVTYGSFNWCLQTSSAYENR